MVSPGGDASAWRPLPAGGVRVLDGVRVLVPRTRARRGLLADRLRHLGAEAVETVVSRLAPVGDPGPLVAALPGADAFVFADADEVGAVAGLLRRSGEDVHVLADLTLVAVGDDAAAALGGLGLACVQLAAEAAGAGDVGAPVPDAGLADAVAVCGSASPPAGVRAVRRVPLVRDQLADADAAIAEQVRCGGFDVVAFASSTAASATAQLYGPLPRGLRVAAMGRRTAGACRDAGVAVDALAEHPGIFALADAVIAAAGRRK